MNNSPSSPSLPSPSCCAMPYSSLTKYYISKKSWGPAPPQKQLKEWVLQVSVIDDLEATRIASSFRIFRLDSFVMKSLRFVLLVIPTKIAVHFGFRRFRLASQIESYVFSSKNATMLFISTVLRKNFIAWYSCWETVIQQKNLPCKARLGCLHVISSVTLKYVFIALGALVHEKSVMLKRFSTRHPHVTYIWTRHVSALVGEKRGRGWRWKGCPVYAGQV